MYEAILAILLSLPPCFGEPSDVERMAIIASAIAAVSRNVEDAAGLLTIGTFESAWCRDVHSGARRGGAGEGLWQIEPGSRRQKPYSGVDLKSTCHAAGQALWLWRHSWQCGPASESRFKAYAGVACGKPWAGAARRGKLFRWLVWRLRSAV
jgi:hypothetical protein